MPVQPKFLVAGVLGCLGLFGGRASLGDDGTPPLYSQIERGRYLVDAGDCSACHTDRSGQPFAGGRAIPTPFGTIYSANITPDKETGIGNVTDDEFWDALHKGVGKKGQHLYPAMPYPWYTRLGHDDVLAIKAYLATLKRVHNEVKAPDLPWPMSWRATMAAWNAMFFKPGVFQVDRQKSPEWNRGAYLVEGSGHCGACHSPKNFLGAVKTSDRFGGGYGEGWFASSLRQTSGEGLRAWSEDDIVSYLKTGANGRTRAMGPMAEVVEKSTSHLSDSDLHDIALYLKDLPGESDTRSQQASTDQEVLRRGRLVYVDQCEACHMENGEGLAGVFPPLKGNTAVHSHDPASLVRVVLEGADSARTSHSPEGFAMPGFADKLNNTEIADVLTYMRGSFGNQAAAVSVNQVGDVRQKVHDSKIGSRP